MFKFIYRNIYYRLLLAIETKINECLVQMVKERNKISAVEKSVHDPRCGTAERFELGKKESIAFFISEYRNLEIRKKTFEEMKDMIEFLKN